MRPEDHELLQRFGGQGDQEAFAELARRHLPGVLATARRYFADVARAQDAAQIVLTRLAQRWDRVPSNGVLAAWLHADTRLVSLQILRTERRREAREQHAMIEVTAPPTENPDWEAIRPLLDETLALLGTPERDALFLRFFEQRSLREVGDRLGLGEHAARMRLTRALERLREALRRRGVTTTAAALSASLTAHAAPAVLPTLTEALTHGALTASPAAVAAAIGISTAVPSISTSPTALATASSLIMTKTSVFVGCGLLLGVALPMLRQQQQNAALRAESRELRETVQQLQQQVTGTAEQMRDLLAGAELAQQRHDELAALKAELRRLRDSAGAGTSTGRTVAGTGSTEAASVPAAGQITTETEVARFRALSPTDQGRWLGGARMSPRKWKQDPTPEEAEALVRNREVAGLVRPELDRLEDQPAEFAAFQSTFVEHAAEIGDPTKLAAIRDILETTYTRAVKEGLVASARPVEGIEEWARRRDALDREATRQVQALLTDEERARFDELFLGVMGIDLGLGDGKWNRFVRPDGAVIFPSETPPAPVPAHP